ncbi:unnamed protein product [Moneuplotes crassus]|uniref:Uncharacterized protein n=1 Tax=Euplotes crassus TaxID=5936 RepID=A0AAD1Y736_EUPCR|nr:unnamed protein product [Moneuplotes crassus]
MAMNMIQNLPLDNDLFSEDEKALLSKGGFSVSESDAINEDHDSDDDYERKIMDVISNDVGIYGGAFGSGQELDIGERGALEERFKHENNYLQLQLATQKANFYKKSGELERAIERLRREKKQLEANNVTQRKDHELKMIQQKQVTKEELERLQGDQREFGIHGPSMKERMNSYKNELRTLLVSEDKYLDLRSVPENKRNLKEFVQVKAYELVKKYKDQSEDLKRENEDLAEKCTIYKEKASKEAREADRVSHVLNDRENDYMSRIEELQIRNKELQETINKLRMKEESYKIKERDYEAMKERLRDFEKANASLQMQAELQSETVHKVNDQRTDYEKQYDGLRKQIDLLNQDKTFLTRENATLHDRIKRLETDVERVEDQKDKIYQEMSEAKKNAQNYLERLLNSQGEFGSDAQKKHLEELNNIKLAYERDLRLHKENLSEVYEKKIEYLQEAKEESDMRLAKAERDLLEKTKSYDEILVEYRKIERMVDSEIGDVKLELRLKSDELHRVSSVYEENLSLVKELKIENAAMKEKLDLIKNDYYRLEAVERQKNADALAQVAVYKERLAQYEAIEKELDDAIINVAESEEQTEVGDIVLNAVKAAPTAANRRVQQSLLLANRLQAKQKECEMLKKEVKDMKTQMRNTLEDSKMYKRLSDKASQPYSVLMADIEKGEKDLNKAFKLLNSKEDENKSLRDENKSLKMAVNSLNQDLSKLSNKRKQLDNLQSTLMNMIKGSTGKNISVDTLRTKLAESKKKSGKLREDYTVPNHFEMTGGSKHMFSTANTNKMRSTSRSKSPHKRSNLDLEDEINFKSKSKASLAEVPAWYSSLKSNLQ